MQPLSAEIHTGQPIGDDRAIVRRTLRLGVSTYASGDVAIALVLNISESGLLLETVVKLAVGETLLVDIPEAGASGIRVVWTDKLLAGCEFVDPVSTGAVSAAQLKSPLRAADSKNALQPIVVEQRDHDETSVQTSVVIVTFLISVLALIILLAAFFSL